MAKHREDAQPFFLATFGKVGHLRGSTRVNDDKRYRQAETQRTIRAAFACACTRKPLNVCDRSGYRRRLRSKPSASLDRLSS